MRTAWWWPLVVCGAAVACRPASGFDDGFLPVDERVRHCPEGFVPAVTGRACDAVLPDETCGPGKRPKLGSTTCEPVGPTSCAEGFVAAPDGWGCVEVLPDAGCTGATRASLGQTSCQPIGDCAAPFPADATHFVDPRFTPAQLDATHFATLAGALSAAPPGSVIALEAGRYPDDLVVDHAVTLVGRCAEKVFLEEAGAPMRPALTITGGPVVVRRLTITNHFNGALVQATGSAVFQDVVVDKNLISGLTAKGGTLTVERSVIRDTLPSSAGSWGYGLFGHQQAHLTATDVEVTRSRQAGVVFQDQGTTGALERVVVTETRPRGDGTNGIGVVVSGGPTATISRSLLALNVENGLYADSQSASAPTTVTVTDTVVRDSLPRAVGVVLGQYTEYFGRNVMAQGAARIDLTRASIRWANGASLVSAGGATLTLLDSVVYGSHPFPNGEPTSCASVQDRGTLTFTNTAAVRCAGVGLQLFDQGASVTLTRSLVADITRQGALNNGAGLELGGPATLELTDSAVTGCAGDGLLTSRGVAGTDPAGAVSLTRAVVGWSAGYLDGSFGRGLELGGGGPVTVTESAIVATREVAVVVREEGTQARFVRSVVRDTMSNGDGLHGRGFNVQEGGFLSLEDTLLLRNRDVAVMVAQPGSRAELVSTTIADTLPLEKSGTFGWGAGVLVGARAGFTDVFITHAAQVGLAVSASSATVAHSDLRDNAVALHAQGGSAISEVQALPAAVGSTDVLVTEDTLFVGNAARLGTGEVPLPSGAF